MGKFIDLTGQRFGKLTVIERADDYISPNGVTAVRWKCLCDCGSVVEVKANDLRKGKIKSCGCGRIEKLITQSVGKRFGKLTCVGYSHTEHRKGYFFKFKCDCGNEKIYNLARVRNGYINSCGCLREENCRKAVFKDLTGQCFNHLTVIRYIGQKNGRTMWLCKCDCGNEVEVDSSSLKSGNTTACGCRQSEAWGSALTHGKSGTRIYRIWRAMKERCYNPNNSAYHNYGARGITICKEWLDDFMNFYNWSMVNGYRDDLSIDRKDNNGNYEPSNCRWATDKEQGNNTRRNHFVTVNGETHSISQWAEICGVKYSVLYGKIYSGKDIKGLVEKARKDVFT